MNPFTDLPHILIGNLNKNFKYSGLTFIEKNCFHAKIGSQLVNNIWPSDIHIVNNIWPSDIHEITENRYAWIEKW